MSLKLSAPHPLVATHLLNDFECGEHSLNDWLKRRAMSNQINGASRTFVVVDEENRVYGFYAIAAGAVSHQLATSGVRRNMPDPVPVMVLGRLAVDLRAGRVSSWAQPCCKTRSIAPLLCRRTLGFARCSFLRFTTALGSSTNTTAFSHRRSTR